MQPINELQTIITSNLDSLTTQPEPLQTTLASPQPPAQIELPSKTQSTPIPQLVSMTSNQTI